jgi:hypothetical protein
VFTKHDIPIFLAAWAVIWGTAWIFDPSSLVLHLVTYAVIAGVVSAHYIWLEIREEGRFELKSPRQRRRAREAAKGS